MSVNHRLRMNNRILLIETERLQRCIKKVGRSDASLRGMRRLFILELGMSLFQEHIAEIFLFSMFEQFFSS